jgi:hypothetical protein
VATGRGPQFNGPLNTHETKTMAGSRMITHALVRAPFATSSPPARAAQTAGGWDLGAAMGGGPAAQHGGRLFVEGGSGNRGTEVHDAQAPHEDTGRPPFAGGAAAMAHAPVASSGNGSSAANGGMSAAQPRRIHDSVAAAGAPSASYPTSTGEPPQSQAVWSMQSSLHAHQHYPQPASADVHGMMQMSPQPHSSAGGMNMAGAVLPEDAHTGFPQAHVSCDPPPPPLPPTTSVLSPVRDACHAWIDIPVAFNAMT